MHILAEFSIAFVIATFLGKILEALQEKGSK
jgi:hypothetical protein